MSDTATVVKTGWILQSKNTGYFTQCSEQEAREGDLSFYDKQNGDEKDLILAHVFASRKLAREDSAHFEVARKVELDDAGYAVKIIKGR